jgi:hypothetical protein
MAKFMLVLYETPNQFRSMSAEDIQKVIEKYNAWSAKLAQAGKLQGGEKLREEGGRLLSSERNKVTVVDGPYVETKEVIGGFFILEATDYPEAVQLVSDCPHLAYGRIEVREIDPMYAPEQAG